ncbi:MAG TPA: hypothetical protein P5155_00530 [Candidatus Absconditabacterales bacterium]|nr:hypothetical protein [Candidatus Absconditabacterales bacterium]
MVKDLVSSKKLMKLLHKFDRYSKHEKVFVLYLFILLFLLLFFPILKVSSLRGTGGYGVWIRKPEMIKTMFIVGISMFVLLGRNLSFKFKNLFLSYFGVRGNDSLINFLFLFIITTSFFAITDTINVSAGVTSRVVVSGGGKFIQIWLLLGLIFSLISVVKMAQETGKKTKIINMVDDEHKKTELIKDDIKKGLFG